MITTFLNSIDMKSSAFSKTFCSTSATRGARTVRLNGSSCRWCLKVSVCVTISACGVYTTANVMREIQTFLNEQNFSKIDELRLQKIITKIRELENIDSETMEGDEYIDAFEALGGGPGREGTVSKDTLI